MDLSAIVRGYQYAPDQYVIVEPEELDQLRPAKDKALVLEQFVAVQDVDPVFFAGRSLFLLPDGVAARHPYGQRCERFYAAFPKVFLSFALCHGVALRITGLPAAGLSL